MASQGDLHLWDIHHPVTSVSEMTNPVKDWWEETAIEFQKDRDFDIEVNWKTFEPNSITILSDTTNLDVIELGCGGGHCSVTLAKRGSNVVGVDISRKQLLHAQDLATEHGVEDQATFLQADLRELGCIAESSFDLAFNTYVFHWIDNLQRCFEHVFNILSSDGRFVFSMPHPFYDVFVGGEPEPTRSYFDDSPHVLNPGCLEGSNDEPEVENSSSPVTYHHTIADIVTGLVTAGFEIERIREPGVEDPSAYSSINAENGEEFQPPLAGVVPLTLIIEAQKSTST